jgi:hypothetical protein
MTAGGFQMTEDYFEPPLEETDFVLLDVEEVCIALRVVVACEACYPESEIPFDWIIDQVTNRDPRVTEYLMPAAVSCPTCGNDIHEKTLVQWNGAHWLLVRPRRTASTNGTTTSRPTAIS